MAGRFLEVPPSVSNDRRTQQQQGPHARALCFTSHREVNLTPFSATPFSAGPRFLKTLSLSSGPEFNYTPIIQIDFII